jgi:uncharacterized membrane protein YfcA
MLIFWILGIMFDWHHINWLYSLSGLFVGILVGLTGVGGGSLMTPLLVLLFGVAPGTAVGTDLLYAAITKSGGVLVHGFHRTIDWRIVRRLATGSVPATILTIIVLSKLGVDNRHGGHDLISTSLGIALVLTAISLIFRKLILTKLAPLVDGLSDKSRLGITIALGFFLGVCVTVSSVGAGAIGVTILVLLYPSLPAVRIVGADIAHAVPLTLIAGAGHWFLGTVNWEILLSFVIGSVPGIMISSHLASRIPDRILRPLLAGTLAVVGLRLAI